MTWCKFARMGGTLDFSANLSQRSGSVTGLNPDEAVRTVLDAGVPLDQITLSSDANVSMPVLDGQDRSSAFTTRRRASSTGSGSTSSGPTGCLCRRRCRSSPRTSRASSASTIARAPWPGQGRRHRAPHRGPHGGHGDRAGPDHGPEAAPWCGARSRSAAPSTTGSEARGRRERPMGEIVRGRFLVRRWGPPADVVEDGAVYVEDGRIRPPITTRSSGGTIPARRRWATARTCSCRASSTPTRTAAASPRCGSAFPTSPARSAPSACAAG